MSMQMQRRRCSHSRTTTRKHCAFRFAVRTPPRTSKHRRSICISERVVAPRWLTGPATCEDEVACSHTSGSAFVTSGRALDISVARFNLGTLSDLRETEGHHRTHRSPTLRGNA
ncbi:hypothetical protein OH76DRAFT_111159 [Lentinus brumalis]|uniref:Uncharacterized protein n=1 Tax=Lentinus brumalis TaxID=2498619 RepID=A0A371CQ69_9APHY|nr:hypothetical protein OH76DRAFT_111159 [Polyporus brumalis]